MKIRIIIIYPLLITAAMVLQGCQAFYHHPNAMARTDTAFNQGDFRSAREIMTEEFEMRPGGREELLMLMEMGLIEHSEGALDRSNALFERAHELILGYRYEPVLTVREMENQIEKVLISERLGRYRGALFERLLVPAFSQLNFLLRGDLTGARVEAGRVGQIQERIYEENFRKLENTRTLAEQQRTDMIRQRPESGDNQEPSHDYDALMKAISLDNLARQFQRAPGNSGGASVNPADRYLSAFTYFLNGLTYQATGEPGLARQDFERALRLRGDLRYVGPMYLESLIGDRDLDTARTVAMQNGLELEAIRGSMTSHPFELVLIVENGRIARRESFKMEIPTPVAVFSLRLPRLIATEMQATRIRATINGANRSFVEMADLDAMARRSMSDEMAVLLFRTAIRLGSRAVAQYYFMKQMQDEFGDGGAMAAFLASSAVNVLLEGADLRSWSTLPKSVHVARVRLSQPNATVRLEFDFDGRAVQREVQLNLRAGAPNLIVARAINGNVRIQTTAGGTAHQPAGAARAESDLMRDLRDRGLIQ